MEASFLMKQKGDYCNFKILWNILISTLLHWYLPLSGDLQVVLVLKSSIHCDSLNVSTQHSYNTTNLVCSLNCLTIEMSQ